MSALVLEPDTALAASIATEVTGQAPTGVSRFTTGAQHYVYDVTFADRDAVVVRIGNAAAHREMAGAEHLSGVLRPLGVPLPAIIAADVEAELPWLVLERLPGADLGDVIGDLGDHQLDRIAAGIAAAQAAVAATPSAGRYGYAARPQDAPHTRWSRVLEDNLSRTHGRFVAAGLFDPGLVTTVHGALAARRDLVDRMPPTPFLHDTTTKNVIVADDGTLSGIVDVDDLCFGDPRYVAALTLAALMGYGGPVHYVSAWLEHAGHADDAIFQLYVAIFLLDLMSEHGHAFNGNEQPSNPRQRAVLLEALEATLRRVLVGPAG